MSEPVGAPYVPQIDVAVERRRPRVVALLFCHFYSQDSLSRNNLMGCFDRIFADPKTKLTGAFYIFVRTAEIREGQVIISFVDPDGETVANAIFEADLGHVEEGKPVHVQLVTQMGFGVSKAGVYWVDVSYKGESLGGTALTIEFKEEEAAEKEIQGEENDPNAAQLQFPAHGGDAAED